MRELLDELIEVVLQMWDRCDDDEYTLEDIGLPIKAALIISEMDDMSAMDPASAKASHKKNKKEKKKFKFFSS